jgi:hypothetical protein
MAKKYEYEELKKVVLDQGHDFFEGNMNPNFIGIRSVDKQVNEWNDTFCLAIEKDGQGKVFQFDSFTTDPGIYYLKHKLLNPEGCAIVAKGQHKGLWAIGKHGKHQYEAFVQVGTVRIHRDNDRDNELDLDADTLQDAKWIGINMHHGYNSSLIGPNSAGCQVFKWKKDLEIVLKIAKDSIPFGGNRFSYTLLEDTDF